MPESPKIESASRTEVDAISGSGISLKWSAADNKAYGMTIYQKNGVYVMGTHLSLLLHQLTERH